MYGISVQGKKHMLRNIACEDSIYIVSEPGEAFVGVLCDGMGSYSMSGAYAKELAKEVAIYLYENRNIIFETNNNDFKNYFFKFEKAFTQKFARKNPAAKFGSTLIAVVIPAKQNEFAILHVGDGAVLGTSKCNSEFAMVFSNAENYGSHDATISISNHNAKSHMRFIRQRKEDYDCILFGSDGGIAPFATNTNIASGYTYDVIRDVVMGKRSLAEVVFEDHFGDCNETDDISLLLLEISDLPPCKSIHCYINSLTPEELKKKVELDGKSEDQNLDQNLDQDHNIKKPEFSSDKNGYQESSRGKKHDHFRNHKKGASVLIATVCLFGLLAINLYTYSIASTAKKNIENQNEIILELKTDVKDLKAQVNILKQLDNMNKDQTDLTSNTYGEDQDTSADYMPVDDEYR